MTETQMIVILAALAVVLIAVVAGIVARRHEREQSVMLRQRFGPEYDRAVQQWGHKRAERALAERVRHVERVRIRDLSDTERARFAAAWEIIQAQFVDDPNTAVARANDLIKDVMRARGYSPNEGFEQRTADLSVDHPDVVQHYRAAHALARVRADDGTKTEDLRQAVVHYRVIFDDLLAPTPVPSPMLRQAHRPSHA